MTIWQVSVMAPVTSQVHGSCTSYSGQGRPLLYHMGIWPHGLANDLWRWGWWFLIICWNLSVVSAPVGPETAALRQQDPENLGKNVGLCFFFEAGWGGTSGPACSPRPFLIPVALVIKARLHPHLGSKRKQAVFVTEKGRKQGGAAPLSIRERAFVCKKQ